MELPFEEGRRRRIYLMRHAEAAYFNETGARDPDPHNVSLTPNGRRQALAMADWLAPVHFDRAICSGLPRTRETASLVLGGREIVLETSPDLAEIRGAGMEQRARLSPVDYAYSMFRAGDPGATFASGEAFQAFRDRVLPAFADILDDQAWTRLLLVCHGGTNRAILTWFLGLGLDAFGQFEQDSCCLNILDFDQLAGSGAVVRRIVRALKMTAQDTAKTGSTFLSMEWLADQQERAKRAR